MIAWQRHPPLVNLTIGKWKVAPMTDTFNGIRRKGEVPISLEENKAVVRRFYEEIDKGNLSVLDELVAEDYLDHAHPLFPGLPLRFTVFVMASW